MSHRRRNNGSGDSPEEAVRDHAKKRRRRKIMIITAVILLLIMMLSTVLQVIFLLFSDNDDESDTAGMSTTTYLYVQLVDADNKGISNATVHLKQATSKNPAEYQLGQTDKDGIASMVMPIGGNAKFTYPCPPEFKPDSSGRPTVYFKVYHHGNTFYSQGSNHGYGSGFGFSQISAKQDHLTSQEGKPAASDTWHILAKQGSGNKSNGMCYDEVCYVAQKGGYDYGTGIIEDWGSGLTGNGADIDCYAPYTKYYAGGESMKSLNAWLSDMGIPSGTSFAHGDGTVYIMGKSESDSVAYGSKIRKTITANGGQPWPGTTPADPRTGGGGSAKANDKSVDKYFVSYSKDGSTSDKDGKIKLNDCIGHVKEDPLVVKADNHTYKFWCETVTNGVGGGGDLAGLNSEADLQAKPEANANYGVGRSKYHGISTYDYDNSHGSGKPLYTGSALCNCTSWVNLRAYETCGRQVGHPIYSRPSTRVTKVSDLNVGDFVRYGNQHVAFIEAIDGDSITISESGQTNYIINKKAGSTHPWYDVVTVNGVKGLQAHHSGTLYVIHQKNF